MPKFNTANPTTVGGKPLEPPEDYLFRMVREAMCAGEPQGISFEMLAQKNCDQELLDAYQSVDDLIDAVVDDMIERLGIIWEPVTAEAREYLGTNPDNRDWSVQKLERLIYRHTYQALHPKNRSYMLLCSQENLLPARCREKVAAALRDHFTSVLTGMIMAASEIKNQRNAAILAAQVIGNVNFYVMQPELRRKCFWMRPGWNRKWRRSKTI